MKKEYNNNEVIKYATQNVATGLTDVIIKIFLDNDGTVVVNNVLMEEYIPGFYRYSLGSIAIGQYSGTISSVSGGITTDFGLEIVSSESGLTNTEHDALINAEVWARKAGSQRLI